MSCGHFPLFHKNVSIENVCFQADNNSEFMNEQNKPTAPPTQVNHIVATQPQQHPKPTPPTAKPMEVNNKPPPVHHPSGIPRVHEAPPPPNFVTQTEQQQPGGGGAAFVPFGKRPLEFVTCYKVWQLVIQYNLVFLTHILSCYLLQKVDFGFSVYYIRTANERLLP